MYNPNVEEILHSIREHGFFMWPQFLSKDQVELYKRISSDLLVPTNSHFNKYSRSIRIWNLMNYGNEFIALLFDSRLRQTVTRILGSGYLLSDYSLNTVFPNNVPDVVHMDYPFNEMKSEPVNGLLGLQCILTLDEFTAENGATEYIPGTHRHYRLPDKQDVLQFERFIASSGTLLIMAASTWHRAGVNHSNSNRTAMLLCFVERWIRPMISLDDYAPEVLSNASDDQKVLYGTLKEPEEIDGTILIHKAIR